MMLIGGCTGSTTGGIKVFRLSSEMFPHISNPNAPDYTLEFAKDLLNTG